MCPQKQSSFCLSSDMLLFFRDMRDPIREETFSEASESLQAFVVVGDYNGHVGLGVKCAKEVLIPPSYLF